VVLFSKGGKKGGRRESLCQIGNKSGKRKIRIKKAIYRRKGGREEDLLLRLYSIEGGGQIV